MGDSQRAVVPAMAWIGITWGLVIDAPTQWPLIGPLSVSGAATIAVALLTIVMVPAYFLSWQKRPMCGGTPGAEPFLTHRFDNTHVPWPLMVFCAWAVLWLGFDLSSEGVQNVAVYVAFAGGVAGTALSSTAGTAGKVRQLFIAVGWVVSLLVLAGAVVPTLHVFGARSFALTALILLAVVIPERTRRRGARLLPYVIVAAIAVGLSRTALATAGLMLPFLALRGASRGRVTKGLALYAAAGLSAYLLITRYAPLKNRFLQGDASYQVGGLALNTSGRTVIWRRVMDSIRSGDPLLGQGPGSAAEYVVRTFGTVAHPHNEYLRIWHDFGIVGLGLFVSGYLTLMWRTWRNARRADSNAAAVHWTAFLALAAVAATAYTDNVLVYPFVMLPLGVVVGLSVARPVAPADVPPASPTC